MLGELETSPVYFAEEILKISLYPWQDIALSWFEDAPLKRVKGTLSTPNGAGKSERVVATLVLWWLTMFPQGKAIVTTKSGLQLDTQLCPAIEKHRGKFEKWKFIERRVETPTGGLGIFFVTDEIGRAEGHHPVGDPADGPVLIVVDEAKSVPDGMFSALDRCNYQALLYVSSPGGMAGRFYESHFKPELGFKTLRVGLKDCPHIPKEKIDDIIATYGSDSAYTMSTLHGEFVEADTEARFHTGGLKRLKLIADSFAGRESRGVIEEHGGRFSFHHDPKGWVWLSEEPRPGLCYAMGGDPMTGKQSEGSLKRDNHAVPIVREAYVDRDRRQWPTEVVAAIHVEDGCRWDLDVLAERMWRLSEFYGGCVCVPEANNAGMELISQLRALGVDIWQREDIDHTTIGKKLKKPGYWSGPGNSGTRNAWVEAVATAVRESSGDPGTEQLICRYMPAMIELQRFIRRPDGSCGAMEGYHDDWVTAIGIVLRVGNFSRMPLPVSQQYRHSAQMTVLQRGMS